MANILMLIPALYCGGGLQKISLQLCQELLNRQHHIVVVDEYDAPKEKIKYLNILPVFEKIDSYLCTKSNLQAFSDIVRNHSIDLIIYQGFFQKVNKFLKEWKKTNDTKIISVYHNSPDSPMPQGIKSMNHDFKGIIKSLLYPLYYLYSKYKVGSFLRIPYSFSENIILLSKQFINIYEEFTGVRSHITVIPNFINTPNIEPGHRKKQLIYVGRLEEEQKKVSRIIHIWEQIAPLKTDWKLILVGEGKCRNQYESYIRNKNIERVEFLGYVSNPEQLYSESAISLMTSDFEGFSIALIESMAVGCVPIVYSSFRSITDIIDDKKNGVLVPPFQEHQFINKLLHLMDNEDYLTEMSMEAIKKSKLFSSNKIIPLWENIINSVI